MAEPQRAIPEERTVELGDLGESHAGLRVLCGDSVREMRELLKRHGQLMPLVAYATNEAPLSLEIVDGFKRLRGARQLGWRTLRVRVFAISGAEAKAAVSLLNAGRGLSGLEEAWVVRALYREERLTQPAIGQLLGRDKSWVSRRLLLAEGLDDGVQIDVRLGLLAARTAEALCRLPRGNQPQAAEVVMKRGLTQHQTDHWVKELVGLSESEREAADQGQVDPATDDHDQPDHNVAQHGFDIPPRVDQQDQEQQRQDEQHNGDKLRQAGGDDFRGDKQVNSKITGKASTRLARKLMPVSSAPA